MSTLVNPEIVSTSVFRLVGRHVAWLVVHQERDSGSIMNWIFLLMDGSHEDHCVLWWWVGVFKYTFLLVLIPDILGHRERRWMRLVLSCHIKVLTGQQAQSVMPRASLNLRL
jgi:hypothetical protein